MRRSYLQRSSLERYYLQRYTVEHSSLQRSYLQLSSLQVFIFAVLLLATLRLGTLLLATLLFVTVGLYEAKPMHKLSSRAAPYLNPALPLNFSVRSWNVHPTSVRISLAFQVSIWPSAWVFALRIEVILHFLTIACAQQWVHIRLSTNVSSILPLFIKIKWDTSAIEIKYFLLLATHFFSIFTKNYCIFSRQLVHNNTEYWTTSLSENEDYVRFRGWWDELVVTGMAPFIALVFFNARIYRKIRWER